MLEEKKDREDAIEDAAQIDSGNEKRSEMEEIEGVEEETMEEERKPVSRLITLLTGGAILVSGIIVTLVLCMLQDVPPTLSMWPLAVGVDAFFLTTFGFFTSEGAAAIVYEVFCAISFICCVLQTLLLF